MPVYPHHDLRVNTVFEVARAHGLRTAWADKHPAYEILNGPSGTGVQDLFTPEINSVADSSGDDWSTDNALTHEYDSIKVAAVLNEIDGLDHSGARKVGTPAVFGMNFQTVSTAREAADVRRPGRRLQPRRLTRAAALTGDGRHQRPGRHPPQRDPQEGARLAARRSSSRPSTASRRRTRRRCAGSTTARSSTTSTLAWAPTHPKAAPLVTFTVNDDGMLHVAF